MSHPSVVLSLVVAAALAGPCVAGCARNEGEAVAVVRRYDALVADAYRSGQTAQLEQVAGPKDLSKILALVDINRTQGIYLDSRLLNLEVQRVEWLGADRAQVWAREDWEYSYRRISDAIPTRPPIRQTDELVYILRKDSGRWLIEEVRWQQDIQ